MSDEAMAAAEWLIEYHAPSDPKDYVPKDVAKTLLVARALLAQETDVQPEPWTGACPYCTANFVTRAELEEHIRAHRPWPPDAQAIRAAALEEAAIFCETHAAQDGGEQWHEYFHAAAMTLAALIREDLASHPPQPREGEK